MVKPSRNVPNISFTASARIRKARQLQWEKKAKRNIVSGIIKRLLHEKLSASEEQRLLELAEKIQKEVSGPETKKAMRALVESARQELYKANPKLAKKKKRGSI